VELIVTVAAMAALGVCCAIAATVQQRRHRRELAEEKSEYGRAIVIAMPVDLRGRLEPAVEAAARTRDAASLAALRDAVVAHVGAVRSASAATWCGPAAAFEAWFAERARPSVSDAAVLPAGYREAESGLVVLALGIRHSCELPPPDAITDRASLHSTLANLVPARTMWLAGVLARWEPAARGASWSEETLARAFPELRVLSDGAH
jgi:hypothetical protein